MNLLETLYTAVLADSRLLDDYISEGIVWNVSHPKNALTGSQQIKSDYLQWLKTSLPDIERKTFISFEGESNGETWITSTGYFMGTFANDLLGIPATGKTLFLRFTELARRDGNRINAVYSFLDFIDVMNQARVNPIRPSLGHDGFIMPPTTADGIKSGQLDDAASQQSAQLVKDMLAELGRYDGQSLESMDLGKYWAKDFMWYGPAGIGTTRGIDGFRAHHQGPFLAGFPDRGINRSLCFTSHDNFAATGGWPHMYGTHTGDNWLGLDASGKTVYPRVMDIWRREGGLLKENWVAIDIPDMLMQMGIDIFAMMREKIDE